MVTNKQKNKNFTMISSENNHIYPTSIYPSPLVHSTTYNNEHSTMGRVVRIQPNIYVFICEYNGCETEHRTIDNFFRHSESHFRIGSSPVDTPIHTTTHVHSNFQSLEPTQPDESIIDSEPHIPFNDYAPTQYPEPSTQDEPHPIDIITNPFAHKITDNDDDDNIIEEVYEIIDLGYDPDGKKYPKALHIDSPPVKNKTTPKVGKVPKTPVSPNGVYPCPFCFKKYKKEKALTRHKVSDHSKILAQFSVLKKEFKCLICNTKWPKSKQMEAEKHMKKHFRGQNTK